MAFQTSDSCVPAKLWRKLHVEHSWGSCPRTAPASQGGITRSPGGFWLLLFPQQGGFDGDVATPALFSTRGALL